MYMDGKDSSPPSGLISALAPHKEPYPSQAFVDSNPGGVKQKIYENDTRNSSS